MKKQSGFTLIELMVVMAIIAILATAGLSAYSGYIKKANETKADLMVEELASITESFRNTSGQLPAGVDTMVTRFYNSGGRLSSQENPRFLSRALSLLVPRVFAAPNPSNPNILVVPGSIGGCAHYSSGIAKFDGPCTVVFIKFSDDTYAWGIGIRTKASLVGAFVPSTSNGGSLNVSGYPFAPILNFASNNKSLNTVNTSENNVKSVFTAISNSGVTVTSAEIKSNISGTIPGVSWNI